MTTRPPYSRTERAIALARVPLAALALVIAWPAGESGLGVATSVVLLAAYLVYAATLVPILSPAVLPAGWWPLTTQVADLAVFGLVMVLTAGATSPFFSYFLFSLATATVRWGWRGALATGAVVLLLFAMIAASSPVELRPTAGRAISLGLAAAVFAGLGAAHDAERRQLEALANWPQFSTGDRAAVSRQMLEAAARVLDAPRLLLVWEDSEEPWLETASLMGPDAFVWQRMAPDSLGTLVDDALAAASFLCADMDMARPRVQTVQDGRARPWVGQPVDARLRARFPMRAVISWPVHDGAISGRLFSLDPGEFRIEDVAFGEVVARLIAARLALGELLREVQDRATAEGRLKLADDLHDGVLQSLAAASLQLQAARRLAVVNPVAADARLGDLQQIISAEQTEIRTVIEALAPDRAGPRGDVALEGRLRALGARMARQWGLDVQIAIEPPSLAVPDTLAQQVFLLVQEALANAGRHSGASHASVAILRSETSLSIVISDDGHGFPFTGRFEQEELRRHEMGPRSLGHRVATVGGTLAIDSSPLGARLEIQVPYLVMSA